MSRMRFVGVALAAGLLLGAAPALAAGPYPPPSKGTGTVTPSKIKAGECAVFSGDGFAPNTLVTITDDTGDAGGTTTTTANGTFSKQLCYSTSAKRGRHNLAGSGTGSDGNPLTVYAVLTVQGAQQSASNSTTQAGGAPSGPTAVSGGTSSAVQAPAGVEPPAVPSGTDPLAPAGSSDSGTRLVLLGLTGVSFAFLASLLLLLIARRRRRRDDGDLAGGGVAGALA